VDRERDERRCFFAGTCASRPPAGVLEDFRPWELRLGRAPRLQPWARRPVENRVDAVPALREIPPGLAVAWTVLPPPGDVLDADTTVGQRRAREFERLEPGRP